MDFEETGRLVAAGPALLEVRPGSERGIVGQRVTASTNGHRAHAEVSAD